LPIGTDLLVGGSGGDNTIAAGSGVTTLFGAGSDNLLVAERTDTIQPGAGNDTLSLSIANTESVKPSDLNVGWNRSDTPSLSGYDPAKQSWSQAQQGPFRPYRTARKSLSGTSTVAR
jgi:Ca2+-binding RTX toxin-like protein